MIRKLEWLYWSVRSVWGHLNGRWHVLREAPDWYVVDIASMRNPGSDEEDLSSFCAEARREMALRLNRMKRDLEAMIPKAQDPGSSQ